MYEITDQNSFKNIRNWIKQVEANVPANVCKVLVGNNCHKSDRVVSEEEGKKLADEFNMGFFEASPKTNQNVHEVFNFLVREILKVQYNIIFPDKNKKDKENKKKDYEKKNEFNKNVNLKLYKYLNY